MNGLCMADFANQEEALQAADALVAQNKEEYGHPGTRRDHELPVLTRFWYVKSGGRTKKIKMGTSEALGSKTDDQKAIQQQLALEGPAEGTEQEVVVKIENPSWEPFFAALKETRGSLANMKAQCGRSQSLLAQFLVAGRTNETMKAHHEALRKMIGTFVDFIMNCELKVAEWSLLTAATDKDELDTTIKEMSTIRGLCMAHTDGHKDVVKRYKAILDGKVTLDPASTVKTLGHLAPEQ